ncbi:MAG: hypothetical protein WD646_12040 [Actinomycetota bacterium]
MTDIDPRSLPSGPESRQAPELDDFLSRAVDRQIAEQRALTESLTELRQAVEELATREAGPSEAPQALTEALGELRDAVHKLSNRASEPIDLRELDKLIRGVSEGEVATFVKEFKELRGLLLPGGATSGNAAATRDLSQDVEGVKEAVAGVAADIDGIAQALIDMNSGLRGWAEGVDANLDSLRDGVERVREVASASRELLSGDGDRGGDLMTTRVEGIEERVNETAQLSLYLTDQVEALDKLLSRVGDLPMKLEGVVAQALRRTLATRAKLDKEAEGAIDDVLGAVDEQLEHFSGALQRFAADEGQLHKLEVGQAELTALLESLRASVTARLDEIESERRRTEQELARAIDRSAKGQDPRAQDSLKAARDAPRRSASKSKGKVTKKKPSPTRRQPQKTAKTSSRRATRPSPYISDEALD